MSKVILEFTKGHGRYVKGDVAGFDEERAEKLRAVTKPYDEKAKEKVLEIDVLAKREADLARREQELELRLAAEASGDAPKATDASSAKAGDPPAQGGGAKSGTSK